MFILCPWLFCLLVYLCTHRGKKKRLDSLELELQIVVSNGVGAGNQTMVWGRTARALNFGATSPKRGHFPDVIPITT